MDSFSECEGACDTTAEEENKGPEKIKARFGGPFHLTQAKELEKAISLPNLLTFPPFAVRPRRIGDPAARRESD